MGVVELLDAATAGNVIFTHGHLQLAIVGQVAGGLHQAFAIGAFAQEHRPIHILQRAGDNLSSGGGAPVNQDRQGHDRVDRLGGGAVGTIPLFYFSLGAQHFTAFRHEQAHDLHRTFQDASTIASQVEDQRLDVVVFLQVQEGLFHLLRALDRERFQVDIAHTIASDAIIGHLGRGDLLACDGDFARLLLARSLNGEGHLGVGHTLQQGTDPCAGRGRDINRVDLQDQVAGFEACQIRGHALGGLSDHHPPVVITLTDQRSDAAILTGRDQI